MKVSVTGHFVVLVGNKRMGLSHAKRTLSKTGTGWILDLGPMPGDANLPAGGKLLFSPHGKKGFRPEIFRWGERPREP
ncbi:MAG: hypothetical protein WAO02_04300, partial [Verrucomicrobiia bacterium]